MTRAAQDRLRYDAFISYSHAADGHLAPALRNSLHRLAKPLFQLRALNVFRDETSLSATPGLWSSIEAALSQSRFFILLASPEAVASPWVTKEVEWWCQHRSIATYCSFSRAVRSSGIHQSGDFDWDRTNALPERLRGVFADEPRWIDFRWARTETDVSFNHPAFREGVANLAAPLHGRPKDEIIGEDVSGQRRARTLRAAAVSALTLFALATAVAAWIALEQRDEALIEESKALALTSEQETAAGNTRQAISLSLKALPEELSDPNRPYVPTAEVALARALYQHRELSVLSGHMDDVTSAMFSPPGIRIVTGSDDGTARLWDTATGHELKILRGHEDEVWSAVFNADGTRILTASKDGTARLWDPANGDALTVLRGHEGAVVSALFSPDGTKVVTASRDRHRTSLGCRHRSGARVVPRSRGPCRLCRLRSQGQEGGHGLLGRHGKAMGYSRRHAACRSAWSHLRPVGCTHQPRRCHGCNGIRRRHSAVVGGKHRRGHRGSARSREHRGGSGFQPGWWPVVTASWDGTAQLWDAEDGKPRALLHGHKNNISSVAYSPDGSKLVTASEDNTARLWDGETGAQLAVLRGHEEPVWTAGFSPDGARVITASRDRTARIWDATVGEESAIFRGHKDHVYSAAIGRDGETVATASEDRTARLWSLATGKELLALRGHSGPVRSASFSPDGTFVLTTSADRTARLWDVEAGKDHRHSAGPSGPNRVRCDQPR